MAQEERADVLVIGSGASGGALTWRLTELGAKVVCLEQGDWMPPGELPSTRPDYEIQLRRGYFNFDPNIRRQPQDYPVATAGEDPPNIAMWNGVGGTTVHWQAHFPRFHPSDFRVRELDGVADDWPVSYEDLEPYYDLNDRMMGVSGLAGDPANPPRSQRQTPPLPLGKVGTKMARAFDHLGWHWWVSDQAIVSRDYGDRPACELHGKCMMGCPVRSKGSADVVYWPKALDGGATLKTRSRVQEITVDERGRADGALYLDANGDLHHEKAALVVVAANGVGTPRLLLNSKSKLFPDGLANSNGIVGRNFMIHPTRWLQAVFDEPLDGHLGPMGNPLFSQEFYETDPARGFARGYSLVVERTWGPLSHAWGGFTYGAATWGAGHHAEMRRRFPHMLGLTVLADDLPEPLNRVELDESRTDPQGIPAARATYTQSDNTRRLLDHGEARGREVLEAAGATEIFVSNGNMAHLMGTARMGRDAERSVIDSWNRAHDVPNLFIIDGATFTTGAGVNPTSTIGAIALRAADGIWDRRRDWV